MPEWIQIPQFPPLDAENCCMDEADYGRYSNRVLAFDEDEACQIVAVYDGRKDEWSDARNGGELFGVTHWKPLDKDPELSDFFVTQRTEKGDK